uniref:Transmembrane protein n=1 Tax=Globisporangium ultimum (strain ATCC 200006 / CBS 805.95 / DAOM BR144) TaxID=431595 RepID=K3W500_GLOUD
MASGRHKKVSVLLAVIAATCLSGRDAVHVTFNREHACSFATESVFYPVEDSADTGVADVNLLQSYQRADASSTTTTNGGFPVVPCTEVTSETCTSTKSIVVGISRCLKDSTITAIASWFGSTLKVSSTQRLTMWKDRANVELKLVFVMLRGACKVANGTPVTTRLSTFSQYTTAPLIDGLSDSTLTNANAISTIMFFNSDDDSVHANVQARASNAKLTFTYHFHVNEASTATTSSYLNTIYLAKIDDLKVYLPFAPSSAKRYTCSSANLPGGVPVPCQSRIARCMCTCPKGFEITKSAWASNLVCTKVGSTFTDFNNLCGTCVWDNYGAFKYYVNEALPSCDLSNLISKAGFPMPHLMKSYVTSASEASRSVTISATPTSSPVYDGGGVANYVYNKATDQAGTCSDPVSWLRRRPFRYPTWSLTPIRAASAAPAAKISTCKWTKYRDSPADLFNSLLISSFGKFDLIASAVDSTLHVGSCMGCITVVDNYRPRATALCPTSFSDAIMSVSSLSPAQLASGDKFASLNGANVVTANESIHAVLAFQEKAVNDACSASSRCDDESFAMKNFFGDKYTMGKTFVDAKTCFAPTSVWTDFLGAADATRDLFPDDAALQCETPGTQGRCTRCCQMQVKLKEKWVDYLCDSNYDVERCDGLDSEVCSYSQCLTFSGDTALSADAQIRPTVVAESQNVISKLTQQGYDSTTEIHRALACTSFSRTSDDACTFKAKVADLIDTKAEFHADWSKYDTNGKDASKFVFWRYRILDESNSKWRRLTDAAKHTFLKSETRIIVEAWSQCGLVKSFTFCVKLHVHSPIEVCENFSGMWYQSSINNQLEDDVLCNYPKSDFVELTFDYHPNIGIQFAPDKLHMSINRVECTATFDDRESTQIIGVGGGSKATSLEIVHRFAVELIHEPTTVALLTGLYVQCTFTYLRYDKSTVSQTCDKSFLMQDCDSPCFDKTLGGTCAAGLTDCRANKLPTPYRACGSNVITASSTQTLMNAAGETCCQACADQPIECKPLLDLKEGDIKRCEPKAEPRTTDPYTSNAYAYVTQILAEVGKSLEEVSPVDFFTSPMFLAVVGSAVLVVVAGLVVWKKRAAMNQEQHMEWELYSLMETNAS